MINANALNGCFGFTQFLQVHTIQTSPETSEPPILCLGNPEAWRTDREKYKDLDRHGLLATMKLSFFFEWKKTGRQEVFQC